MSVRVQSKAIIRFPVAIFESYRRELVALVKACEARMGSAWPELEALLDENYLQHTQADSRVERLQRDNGKGVYVAARFLSDLSAPFRVKKVLDRMGLSMATVATEQASGAVARQFAEQVSRQSMRDLETTVARMSRVSAQRAAQGLGGTLNVLGGGSAGFSIVGSITPQGRRLAQSVLDGVVGENVSLIKTIPGKYHSRIEHMVMDGVTKGRSTAAIREDIMKIGHSTTAQAQLIARDQTGTLYGKLNKTRMQGAGLDNFEWASAGDARVRAEHQDYDGNTYSWKKGAPGENFPGRDIQCRCVALPVEEDVLERMGAPAGEVKKAAEVKKPVAKKVVKKTAKPAAQPPQMTNQQWVKSLTSEERKAFTEWGSANPTKGGYAAIRECQRGGQCPSGTAEIRRLMETALNKAPAHKGKVYRGINSLTDDAYNAILRSETVTLDAVSSASTKANIAAEFATEMGDGAMRSVVFEIRGNKTGVSIARAINTPMAVKEQEVLLRGGTRYKVVGHSLKDGSFNMKYAHVILEEI